MPLPEKQPTETRDEFISRCIGEVLDKGEAKDTKQAAGICYSLARK